MFWKKLMLVDTIVKPTTISKSWGKNFQITKKNIMNFDEETDSAARS
jgi:hypothetical protein